MNTNHFLLIPIFSLCAVFRLSAQETPKIPGEFKFKLGISYEFNQEGKQNGSGPANMTFWFSDADYTGIEISKEAQVFMVYDLQKQLAINIMMPQKMYMVMDLKKLEQQYKSKYKGKDTTTLAQDLTISKTGKTENILGYKCEQYLIKSNKGESFIWVTKELGVDTGKFSNAFSMLMKNNPNAGGMPDMKGFSGGVMMKMETTDPASKKKSGFVAKAIHKEGKTIQTEGFKSISMPGH